MKKKEKVNINSVAKDKKICQNCQYHKNNPSTCHVFLDEPRFTGRKQTCEFFKL